MEKFKQIPRHSKYEATGTGTNETLIVRSISAKLIQSKRKDSGKYQLVNDEGARPQISADEIKALFPKERVLTSFGKTEPSKTKQLDLLPIDELDSREDVKRIMNEINFKKHDKIYRLGLLKLSVEQIAEITKSSIGSVQTTLSEYATGKRKGIAGDKKLAFNTDNIKVTPLCNKPIITNELIDTVKHGVKILTEKKKGEKHIPNPKPLNELKEDARKIMENGDTNYNQVIALYKAGYGKFEIIEITGRRNDVISKYLRPFLKK